ncbi:integrase [Gossypium australe]|uniref:Integrase n=1 Tax=Gossypium australe TaxID=47621 RepID=A0A5B6VWL5_9ROSI|nr:integrase [Gossypium australe]
MMIPEWKWEHITMDFAFGLSLTPKRKCSIWVIIDRLTKSVHFIPVQTNYSLEKLVELYLSEFVRLHNVPLSIIFDHDLRRYRSYPSHVLITDEIELHLDLTYNKDLVRILSQEMKEL